MNNIDFALHFAEHAFEGVLFIVLSLVVNLLLLRRYIYSIFDPLLFYAVLSAMGGSVVLYLYHFDLIGSYYFVSYLLTQAAFLGAFLLIKPARPPRRPTRSPQGLYSGPIKVLYPLSVVLFVSSQLLVYSITGLPLFLESRLEAFAGGGGYGLFSRVIFVTSIVSLSLAFYRVLIVDRKASSRLFDYLVIAFSVAAAIVSGSKGALLALIFTVSLSLFFAGRFYPVQQVERKMRRFFLLVLALSFPVAIGAIYVQAGIDEVGDLVSALMMRFLQTGDIFFMVYPNDILERLRDGNGLLALFYSPLGSLRLVDRDLLPVNLGLQAFWYHYDTDLLSGPNARHNVFGLHYFGPVMAVAFSFLLGWLFSVARNTAYRRLPATPVGMVVYTLLVSCAIFIEQDVSGQALEYFFSVLLVFPLLYAISAVVRPERITGRGPSRRPSSPARPAGAPG
jgi:oligosaccharide repeat unit polymerase